MLAFTAGLVFKTFKQKSKNRLHACVCHILLSSLLKSSAYEWAPINGLVVVSYVVDRMNKRPRGRADIKWRRCDVDSRADKKSLLAFVMLSTQSCHTNWHLPYRNTNKAFIYSHLSTFSCKTLLTPLQLNGRRRTASNEQLRLLNNRINSIGYASLKHPLVSHSRCSPSSTLFGLWLAKHLSITINIRWLRRGRRTFHGDSVNLHSIREKEMCCIA